MQTGDGLLVRLTPADGSYLPSQLRAIAEATERFGNGMLEVTQRGNLQLRGLSTQTLPGLNGAVEEAGLRVRSGLPVDIAPLAGIDRDEIADPRGMAAALRAAAEPLVSELGPKVSVVIDSDTRGTLFGVTADIRLTAMAAGLWQLAVAGTATTARPLAVFAEGQAIPAATALHETIAACGRDARAANLSAGQIDVALRGIPGAQPLDVSKARDASARLATGDVVALRDQRCVMVASPPFGAVRGSRLIAFLDTVADLRLDEIRLAPGRLMLLLCADRASADALLQAAAAHGLIVRATDPRLFIAACVGAPACRSAHLATRRLGEVLAQADLTGLPAGTHLHVSGCGKACARPAGPTVSLIGEAQTVHIVAEGTALSPEFDAQLQQAARAFHLHQTVPN
jgi:precorrin-3B synthase